MKVCPDCGSDPFKQYDYDKMMKENGRLIRRIREQAAEHGVEKAQAWLTAVRHEEETKYLQSKVRKQSVMLKKLEDKIKKLGERPYEEMVILNAAGTVVSRERM